MCIRDSLEVIEKYALFKDLIGSTGIVDEDTLNRLKLNVRSLLETEQGNNNELLDLCLDVIYNTDMKALGLNNLIKLYKVWENEREKTNPQETTI